MPKRLYQIKDFSGGLNNLKDPADIADNEVADVSNLTFTKQGAIGGAFNMKNATNNLLSAYDTSHIDHIEAGYGLGYFETDFVRDGVTLSVSVSDQDDANWGWKGFNKVLQLKNNGSAVNLTTSYPVGTRLLITAPIFPADSISSDNQGLYTVIGHSGNNLLVDNELIDSTTAEADEVYWAATVKGFGTGDKILLLAHPDEHKIDVYSTNTAGTNWEQDSITLRSSATGLNSRVLYHKIDDSIRCFDTTDKNNCKVQWYGWINRRHFYGAGNTTDDNSYLGYFAKDNTLLPPTEDGLTSASTATPSNFTTYPASAGTGFELNVISHTDVEGLIPSGVYEFASTFIYDKNQESLPFAYTNTHTISDANNFKALSLNVSAKSPYDPRISGGRIYVREVGSDDEYIMLIDIDLTKGCRTNFSDNYTPWHDAGSSQFNCPTATASANFEVKDFGFITYETINGFASSIFSNALGDQGEFWKDSTVANNRVFICNVTMKDEDSGTNKSTATVKNYPDRIMYSMPNRFDTFPSFNTIEAAKGDADYYTAIESFADRILAYKQYSLDIINISSPSDANWFLEDSKNYMGIEFHGAVAKTQYGIVWVNKQGLYFYDGSQIRDLSENKIDDSTWYSFVTVNSMIIYDEATSLVYVVKNCAGDGDAYLYDFKKGNFTFLKDFAHDSITNVVHTNFSDSTNALVGTIDSSTTKFYKLHRGFQSVSNVSFKTKDFDFGDAARIKKIYAVYVTYKSSVALTSLFKLVSLDDDTAHTLSGTLAITSDYKTVKLTPSSIVSCTKAHVLLDTSATSANVEINDISIEYRQIYKRDV